MISDKLRKGEARFQVIDEQDCAQTNLGRWDYGSESHFYSSRSVFAGSIEDMRRIGKMVAMADTTASSTATASIVVKS